MPRRDPQNTPEPSTPSSRRPLQSIKPFSRPVFTYRVLVPERVGEALFQLDKLPTDSGNGDSSADEHILSQIDVELDAVERVQTPEDIASIPIIHTTLYQSRDTVDFFQTILIAEFDSFARSRSSDRWLVIRIDQRSREASVMTSQSRVFSSLDRAPSQAPISSASSNTATESPPQNKCGQTQAKDPITEEEVLDDT